MSFVTLGGSGEAPTFFELVAAERLMPSLKSAVIYSLSILAQRRPSLNRLLDKEEELFFLTSVLLDRQSLWHHGASFAESIYSLKRIPRTSSTTSSSTDNDSITSSIPSTERMMSAVQRRTSLILITLLPYLRAKLEALYHQATTQTIEWRLANVHQEPIDNNNNISSNSNSSGSSVFDCRIARRWKVRLLRAFILAYPWINASYEGARFGYQLLYLLGRSPYYSPSLHLMRLVVARVSSQEMIRANTEKQRYRSERAQRTAASHPVFYLLRKAAFRSGEVLADHTRSALVLSVFAFKLLEWWYTSAEGKLGKGGKALPPPPPPPALKPAPNGVQLPENPAMCPLCCAKRTNPTMVVTSGYVYCYPCIHRFVEGQGRCPVTHVPAGLDQLRRLYQGI